MIKRLQTLLQWLFLRVEGLFNAAFGDRLNPLYHLGSITFYLFWLVAGSGLYLYAFFETGVADAYASVQALTHGQWFAGGSVHRYASDAMVLTMLLHMVRHFAFNHYRAFRWFSWVSGVALIWGVYVSGINGYMLPWDKLAQFVIVASFEWLDWLPGFGGTLVRNFIYASSVSDRFFSLLSFMHIGIPLVVLLLMWVHVQRVPKARTNPPRSIMISVALTLLVMAVVAPVRSQDGAADLAQAVTHVQLDWFYLLVFPLLTLWPLSQVWALLVGASAVLVLVPWLPPRWRRGAARSYQMSVHGVAAPVAVRSGETLLEAGLREGLTLPYECRNGGCGRCRCSVLHGEVDHGVYQRSALSDTQRTLGQALMCCATPLADLEIEVEGAPPARLSTARYRARVARMERLTPEVMRLTLAVQGAAPPAFVAGQYINIILADGQRRAFSFANPPPDPRRPLHGRGVQHPASGRRAGVRGAVRRISPERQPNADPFRGRCHRLRADQEHRRRRLASRRPAADVAVLGRAPAPRSVPAGTRATVAGRAPQLSPRARAVGARRRMAGPARPGARGDAARLPRSHRPRGLCLRLGQDGRGRSARVHRARSGRGRLLFRFVPAVTRRRCGAADGQLSRRLAAHTAPRAVLATTKCEKFSPLARPSWLRTHSRTNGYTVSPLLPVTAGPRRSNGDD
jgi:ferredoxin/quinol-cytochrome oxidoreductase complex cytochrome b subunit